MINATQTLSLRERIRGYQLTEMRAWKLGYGIVFFISFIGTIINDQRVLIQLFGLLLPFGYGISLLQAGAEEKRTTLKRKYPFLKETDVKILGALSAMSPYRLVIFLAGNATIYLPTLLNIIALGVLSIAAQYVERKAKEENQRILQQVEILEKSYTSEILRT